MLACNSFGCLVGLPLDSGDAEFITIAPYFEYTTSLGIDGPFYNKRVFGSYFPNLARKLPRSACIPLTLARKFDTSVCKLLQSACKLAGPRILRVFNLQ